MFQPLTGTVQSECHRIVTLDGPDSRGGPTMRPGRHGGRCAKGTLEGGSGDALSA